MCGINGIAFTETSRRRVDADVLKRMRDTLTHRGPDEAGLFIDDNIGLGHRRLSIIDLESGQQPMTGGGGQRVIVYNGEVYDHAQTRRELLSLGRRFRTNCDTETILQLYEELGQECVHKLRGMFAFAIWDKSKKHLFIARDRLGVKPLYYVHNADGTFYFASEIKALLAAGAVKPQLNYAALSDYLANHGTCDDQTLFAGVRRVPAGHTLVWRDGQVLISKYWDLEFEPKFNGRKRTAKDWASEWLELFREAVELRLMADVPLGMFLSGGIDSSAIAAVMSGMVPEPIKTFSVAFAEREANELEYARIAADTFRTDHHEVVVSPQQFFEALPALIWHEDEPIAHPSSIALGFVSQLASRHVKVVLTGEGSDESLAGYGRYAKTLINLRLGNAYRAVSPRILRKAIAAGIEKVPASTAGGHKLRKSFFALEPGIESVYFDNFAVFPRRLQDLLLTDEAKARMGASTDPYRTMSDLFNGVRSSEMLDRMLYTDTKTYLHELLMKQDQMSMSASIESRVPFLDHKLVEFSARIPTTMKLRGSSTKFVLREAMRGILPEVILNRPKMGFPVPVGKWFRGEYRHLIDDLVLSDRALDRGIFNSEVAREVVERHHRGENHDERLWALVNFELWQRRFIDAEL